MVAYSNIRYALNGYIFRVTGILAIGAFTFGYDCKWSRHAHLLCYTYACVVNWWGAMIAHPYFNSVFGDSLLPLPGGSSIRALSATQQSVSTGVGSLGTIVSSSLDIEFCLDGLTLARSALYVPRLPFNLTDSGPA